MKNLKIAAGLILCLFGVTITLFGFMFFIGIPEQKISDQRFKEKFSPIISYVEDFHTTNGCYPNYAEFENWKALNGMENKAIFLYSGILPGDKEFEGQVEKNSQYIISMWRGEWDVFYIAQQKRFFPEDYGYNDALIQFLKVASIGGLLFLVGCILIIFPRPKDQKND